MGIVQMGRSVGIVRGVEEVLNTQQEGENISIDLNGLRDG
jgi:hypothetical protein